VHEAKLSELLNLENLENVISKYGCELAQLFDSFQLKTEVAKDLMKKHPVYKGVVEAISR
jgi:hypothetical protein